MKEKLKGAAAVAVVLAAMGGWMAYEDSDRYRQRFETRFNSLKVGDTYERMVDVLGKANVHCTILRFHLDMSAPDDNSMLEVYRIAGYEYRVEYATKKPKKDSRIVNLFSFAPNERAGGC